MNNGEIIYLENKIDYFDQLVAECEAEAKAHEEQGSPDASIYAQNAEKFRSDAYAFRKKLAIAERKLP